MKLAHTFSLPYRGLKTLNCPHEEKFDISATLPKCVLLMLDHGLTQENSDVDSEKTLNLYRPPDPVGCSHTGLKT